VLTFFGASASFIFIPLSAWLLQLLGWRTAVLVLTGILAVITIPPHALLLRRCPQDLGLLPDGASVDALAAQQPIPAERSVPTRAALREASFWWLTFAFAVSTLATIALAVDLILYLVERHHSATLAVMVAGRFGLMPLAGRLLIGPLGDRFPRHCVTAGLMGMQIADLAELAVAPTIVRRRSTSRCLVPGQGH
jgi:sugar phosphate permease